MYDRTSTCNDINTARRKLCAKKGRPLESIPPTHHALVQHVRRAVYQGSLSWARYYKRNLNSHVQVSGVGKGHLKVSSNQFGQHYLKLQRSAMNLSAVDAQNDALDGASVRSLHFHAHRYVHVMGMRQSLESREMTSCAFSAICL